MTGQFQKLRVGINTALGQEPVWIEVEGTEVERLRAMTADEAIQELLPRVNGHPTARMVRSYIETFPRYAVEINASGPQPKNTKLGRFIGPERRIVGGQGTQAPTLEELTLRVVDPATVGLN